MTPPRPAKNARLEADPAPARQAWVEGEETPPAPASRAPAPEQGGSPGGGADGSGAKKQEGGGAGTPLERAAALFRTRKSPAQSAKERLLPVATRHLAKVVSRQIDQRIARENRALKSFIRPENAEVLLPHLPTDEAQRLHAVIAGDFIFCDLVCAIITRHGAPRRLTLATLSLSHKNLAALERLIATHAFPIDLLLSGFFEASNAKIYAAVLAVAARCPLLRVRVARSHSKVSLFDYPDFPLVIESSANLRSSRNIEQVSIFCDRELLDFHTTWIEEASTAEARSRAKESPAK